MQGVGVRGYRRMGRKGQVVVGFWVLQVQDLRLKISGSRFRISGLGFNFFDVGLKV